MAVCPFHNDRGPSLSISDEKGLFHCFGCGKSGNVITFLMEYENIPFKEALEQLAREAGVALRDRPKNEARDRLYRLNEEAADFFFDTLMTSNEARQARLYLKERKVSRNIIEAFRLGYAPASGNHLCRKLKEKGATMEEMDKLFLAREGKNGPYDLFRDRIMFPICDPGGNVIAFGGRALQKEQQPKYLNSGETPLFKKSQTLYGLHLTRREIFASRSVVVVEGYMDLLALYQYGIKNVVAVLGTAFTRGHAELLTNRVDDITLFFDNDEAGQRATIRSLEQLFNTGINTWVVINNAKKDPDEVIRSRGSGFIKKMINEQVSGFDYFVRYHTEGTNSMKIENKATVYNKMKGIFKNINDESRRNFFIKELDQWFKGSLILQKSKKYIGKRETSNMTNRCDINRNDIIILLYFIENPDYATTLMNLYEDRHYFIKSKGVLEEFEKLYYIYKKTNVLSDYDPMKIISDNEVKKMMAQEVLKYGFNPSSEQFLSLVNEIKKMIILEKKKEEILEKELE